jgi:5-bromo-4-chloroindolyl phosphate hydrolysis protein
MLKIQRYIIIDLVSIFSIILISLLTTIIKKDLIGLYILILLPIFFSDYNKDIKKYKKLLEENKKC